MDYKKGSGGKHKMDYPMAPGTGEQHTVGQPSAKTPNIQSPVNRDVPLKRGGDHGTNKGSGR